MIVSEMIRNGFLQQSAFDAIDVYSVAGKQVAILNLMMMFYHRALDLMKKGAPLSKILHLPVREDIIRIKTTVPNDRLDMIQEIESKMQAQFGSLEQQFQRKVAL